ncbi:MAG: hypothetical protein J2P46_05365 [Zavarzinella sp.]|nr:hypothetical protein [Zavarzinella sp.]
MDTTYAAPLHTMVIGVFDNTAHARAAVEDLRRAGFRDDQIGFLSPEVCGRESPARKDAGCELPVDDRGWFENELKDGKQVVIVMKADERAEDAREALRHHHGEIREPSEFGIYGTGRPATPY